jgi:hypothetical protein
MWNDNESLSDYIDYSHLLKAVTTIIDTDNLLPCSIGIYGDWGSGKSSLMRMVEQKYEDDSDILVIKFNGWLFEGYEDAKSVLMGRIVDEIISQRKFSEKAIKYAAKLLKRVDWIKVAGSSAKYGMSFLTLGPVGLAGVSLADTMSKMKDVDYEKYIKDKQDKSEDSDETLRSNIQEFHKNFEALIEETKIKKIVVFIDDLDRCSPDTIIGTLEAIKLFLFTKKTAFVIGADERLIKYAVKRRFPEVPGENLEVGRDYLEKLIQYPIRIPPLNKIELTTYVNLLFSQLYSTNAEEFEKIRDKVMQAKITKGFDFTLDQSNISDFFQPGNTDFDDAIALCSQIIPVLNTGLNGNPRQAKRFLNTMLIRISMASAKGITLKRRMLAKLMLLEYFKPETFTHFHDIQAGNNGEISLIEKLENIGSAPKVDDNEGAEEQTSELTPEEKILLEDNWITDWIQSEPKLAKENLQAYFYFSRDKLTISAVNIQRMTPKAQDVIQKLLSESEAVQKIALSSLSSLSSSEAASIFEALAQKVRQEENLSNSKAFKALFELSREKTELKSQIVTFLSKYPDHKLPLVAVTLTEGLLKDSNQESLNQLFTSWSKSSNTRLANLVKNKTK